MPVTAWQSRNQAFSHGLDRNVQALNGTRLPARATKLLILKEASIADALKMRHVADFVELGVGAFQANCKSLQTSRQAACSTERALAHPSSITNISQVRHVFKRYAVWLLAICINQSQLKALQATRLPARAREISPSLDVTDIRQMHKVVNLKIAQPQASGVRVCRESRRHGHIHAHGTG